MKKKVGLKKRGGSFTDSWSRLGILYILPTLIIITIFIIVPICMNFWLAFTNYKGYGIPFRYIGMVNFKDLFTDANFWLVMKNTGKLLLIYVLALNTLAVIFAILVNNVGRKFGNFVKSLLYFPCLLAGVVIGFVWRLILNYHDGLLNVTLRTIGLDALASNWLGESHLVIPVVSLVIVWFATGYYTVIYYAGLMNISPEFYEVCDIEGANGLQQFRYVTLPLLAPSIKINVVLSTMGVLGSYDLPTALTAGGGPGYYGTTISMLVYRTAYEKFQYGRALAVAVVMAIAAVIIAYCELKLLLKREVH
jgi:ABC-type sugar transport system permease subunit